MSMLVISEREYATEVTGVVPSVDIIENPTPRDIINNPITNEKILLIYLIIGQYGLIYLLTLCVMTINERILLL